MKRRNFIRDASLGSIALTGVTGVLVNTVGCTGNSTKKRPEFEAKNLAAFKPLELEETNYEIFISGGTFVFTLCKLTGLITSVKVLGDEWLTGHLPDMWASAANDPVSMQYFARFTPSINVKIVEALPHQVVISARGSFATINKNMLPLNYSLLYTFDIDGTVKVDTEFLAEEDIVLRWLTLTEGRISRACQFISHEHDLGIGPRTCSPTDYAVLDDKDLNIGGKFIPWFHFGNDKGGLELIFPHSENRHACYTDSSPFPGGDPMGRAYDLFTLKKDNQGITLTSFAIRNQREVIGPDSSFKDSFFISVMPGRKMRPETNSMQIQWIGPHQYRSNWKHPDENTIRSWALGGVNTVIGGANWYSGDYSNCSMPGETKQFVDTCHRYGLKVLPYITFTDQEYPTSGFDKTGPKWRIEPVVEFNYRSQLMCYGSEEWIEHWHNEISRIFDQFPFDGLYIDFWAGKMNCYNAGHGCVGPYGRFTVEGLRRMARIAREVVDTNTENGVILSNTNILPLAMINNWMDARLYGEWHNLEDTDPLALRIYYNAHRYGTGNVLYCNKVPQITERTLALSGLFQGYPVVSHARTPEGRTLLERNALMLQAFGANKAVALNKFEMGVIQSSAPGNELPGTSVYYHPENQEILICLSSFKQPASKVQIGPVIQNILDKISGHLELGDSIAQRSPYYFYVFEDRHLIGGRPMPISDIKDSILHLPADSYRNIWIKPATDKPAILYALSNGDKSSEEFRTDTNELVVNISSKARTAAETVILGKNPKAVKVNDREVYFASHEGWWESEFPVNTDLKIIY